VFSGCHCRREKIGAMAVFQAHIQADVAICGRATLSLSLIVLRHRLYRTDGQLFQQDDGRQFPVFLWSLSIIIISIRAGQAKFYWSNPHVPDHENCRPVSEHPNYLAELRCPYR
jgi:hypothetical protein